MEPKDVPHRVVAIPLRCFILMVCTNFDSIPLYYVPVEKQISPGICPWWMGLLLFASSSQSHFPGNISLLATACSIRVILSPQGEGNRMLPGSWIAEVAWPGGRSFQVPKQPHIRQVVMKGAEKNLECLTVCIIWQYRVAQGWLKGEHMIDANIFGENVSLGLSLS